jgi:hypothetical protein
MITAAAVALVGAHLFSFHTEDSFNTFTPGLYVKWQSGVTAGVVLNSHGDPSVYGAYTFETRDRRFALTVGAITGYKSMPLAPMVIPSFVLGNYRVSYLPRPPWQGASDAIHISREWIFK